MQLSELVEYADREIPEERKVVISSLLIGQQIHARVYINCTFVTRRNPHGLHGLLAISQ